MDVRPVHKRNRAMDEKKGRRGPSLKLSLRLGEMVRRPCLRTIYFSALRALKAAPPYVPPRCPRVCAILRVQLRDLSLS